MNLHKYYCLFEIQIIAAKQAALVNYFSSGLQSSGQDSVGALWKYIDDIDTGLQRALAEAKAGKALPGRKPKAIADLKPLAREIMNSIRQDRPDLSERDINELFIQIPNYPLDACIA